MTTRATIACGRRSSAPALRWRWCCTGRPARSVPICCVTLVEAGGLAIEIARLRVELRRQLAEVEASRARIVAAGQRRAPADRARPARRRTAAAGVDRAAAAPRPAPARLGEPERADETLDDAVAELAAAIDELRELAHGLPPAQLDAGLDPALRELAGRAPLPVERRRDHERFSVGLEATAYFVACEGLTNAIKHARATAIVLSAQRSNGSLVGPCHRRRHRRRRRRDGSGLRGPADRVAAHGGSLHIDSAPARARS